MISGHPLSRILHFSRKFSFWTVTLYSAPSSPNRGGSLAAIGGTCTEKRAREQTQTKRQREIVGSRSKRPLCSGMRDMIQVRHSLSVGLVHSFRLILKDPFV